MPVADALSTSGLINPNAVARIRSGKGNQDAVQDVGALVVLLTPHEAAVEVLHGKGALSAANQAATAAQRALGTPTGVSLATREAADLRDRYATLIVQGHDRLRAAVAAVSSFKKATQIVGPLARRTTKKSKAMPVAPDAPAMNPS